jgi:hypothetical protein
VADMNRRYLWDARYAWKRQTPEQKLRSLGGLWSMALHKRCMTSVSGDELVTLARSLCIYRMFSRLAQQTGERKVGGFGETLWTRWTSFRRQSKPLPNTYKSWALKPSQPEGGK